MRMCLGVAGIGCRNTATEATGPRRRRLPLILVCLALILPRFAVKQVCGATLKPTVGRGGNFSGWRIHLPQARAEAARARKYLLIYCNGPDENSHHRRFLADTCRHRAVCRLLETFVAVRVSRLNIRTNQKKHRGMREHAFEGLAQMGGLAIIDYSDPTSGTYGDVIGELPFRKPSYYAAAFESPSSVATFLQLPPGTLGERMMIYAIRMHPSQPRSTAGVLSPVLCTAAAAHSQRQALLGRQGHHRWASRFTKIWDQIGGKPPVEVCAESWPEEPLVTACLGCVHAWHQSEGHWRSVAGQHPRYAYSIHRGENGIWYATGIFGG